MNRLIIIGNGFDIAHGLKTKYSDLISHYWKQVNHSSYADNFVRFQVDNINLGHCESLKDVVEVFSQKHGVKPSKKSYSANYYINNIPVIEFKNEFFCRINEKYDNANWVDIEMEYFESLKRILNRPINNDQDAFEKDSFDKILKLNNEIAAIAKKFEEYLIENVVPQINSKRNDRIESLFYNNSIQDHQIQRFYEEFPKRFVEKTLKVRFEPKNLYPRRFDKTYILNFNYTKTVLQYLNDYDRIGTIINIHGELDDLKNPINLGFGDEKNEFYSTIENHNQNEYLRFMKSFQYSRNNNYKNLFDYIEEDNFQVQIMGHSCGLSDRTLLNAIFEHGNCKSIKVFFHSYKVPMDNGEFDNHSEVVRNISRHFTQKTNMRDKIVNRVRCEELPQA